MANKNTVKQRISEKSLGSETFLAFQGGQKLSSRKKMYVTKKKNITEAKRLEI